MSNTADNHRAPQDVAFKPAGIGLTIRARCMGCDQPAPVVLKGAV